MNSVQEKKEVLRLELSNKALKRENAWSKSWFKMLYLPAILFIGMSAYFIIEQEVKATDAMVNAFIFTIFIIIIDITANRIFRSIWMKYFITEEV